MLMDQDMKVTGNKAILMDLGYLLSLMALSIKDTGRRESIMEKAYTKRQVELSMMENG